MEEFSYKDLTDYELDNLKDLYITSRVNSMTENELINSLYLSGL